MSSRDTCDIGIEHFKREAYEKALEVFGRASAEQPTNWFAWYGAGKSLGSLGRLAEALDYLAHALRLASNEPELLLAYGITLRLHGDIDEAKVIFGRAIEIDPDYAEASDSLAALQVREGEFEKPLANCETGIKTLARRVAKSMTNDPWNPLIKHRDVRGLVWMHCASFGARWLSAEAGVDNFAWPTGDSAVEEERTELHRGLYFIDTRRLLRGTTRAFLPNYFATFREKVREEPAFAKLVAHQAPYYRRAGEHHTALLREQEARISYRPD